MNVKMIIIIIIYLLCAHRRGDDATRDLSLTKMILITNDSSEKKYIKIIILKRTRQKKKKIEKKLWKINLSTRLYVTTVPHGTHSSLLPRQRIVGDGGETGREKFRSPPGAYTLVVVVAATARTHTHIIRK